MYKETQIAHKFNFHIKRKFIYIVHMYFYDLYRSKHKQNICDTRFESELNFFFLTKRNLT